jgi:hypothetical protein
LTALQGSQTTRTTKVGGQIDTQGGQTARGSSVELISMVRSALEVISSGAEIELKEEKVYTHLNEDKDRDAGTLVLDTRAINHMSGC